MTEVYLVYNGSEMLKPCASMEAVKNYLKGVVDTREEPEIMSGQKFDDRMPWRWTIYVDGRYFKVEKHEVIQ